MDTKLKKVDDTEDVEARLDSRLNSMEEKITKKMSIDKRVMEVKIKDIMRMIKEPGLIGPEEKFESIPRYIEYSS